MSASPIDKPRIEAAVRELIAALGEDPARDGLLGTPDRVARMYAEVFSGIHTDPGIHLETQFDLEFRELILFRDVKFFSMCEHHLMPFFGSAHIAYIPNGRITGLSKVVRSFKALAARPQVQERLTGQMADLLVEKLSPLGAAVVVEARHMCMEMRGVRSPNSLITTSALRGLFKDRESTRNELFTLIAGGRS
jgi:GTP cyclohydrolase I